MKISPNINMLNSNNIDKMLSKKILLANTANKVGDKLGVADPANPLFFKNTVNNNFKADIRYRNNMGYSAFEDISMRNMLLMFAENNEIKKALNAIVNEMVVTELKSNKYPVYPTINKTLISSDKHEIVDSMLKYINEIFYPKVWHMLNLGGNGLKKLLIEYFTTGKLSYEIVFDNPKRPKEIVNIIPIDPAELSKIKSNGNIYYIQKPTNGGKERIMHENQVILIEYNEYDYGYVSYVHTLQRPYNIMRSMMNAKINWFAVKSQVRMHVNLNMGDLSRIKAEQLIIEAKDEFVNKFTFNDSDGTITFNDEPGINSYMEFFTAETANSGSATIEEINSNGPDLTEVDSLQYFEKYFWKQTDIPYDRIDPSSSETWNFVDVSSVKKSELLFSKFILDNKIIINEIFMKLIIIQLTIKEVEIGVDLSLLDAINIDWVSFNEYEKLAELEVLDKQVQLANSLMEFGTLENADGQTINKFPIDWIIDNYFDYTEEQKTSMQESFIKQQIELGYINNTDHEVDNTDEIIDEEWEDETIDDGDNIEGIIISDDENF